MSRRIIIGILVASLIAPGVGVPHSHANIETPPDHDKTPHSHLRNSWLGTLFLEDHGHEHDGDCEHSHEHGSNHSHDGLDEDVFAMPVEKPEAPSDQGHDADALYVSGFSYSVISNSRSQNHASICLFPLPQSHVAQGLGVPPIPTPESLPPPLLCCDCPIYLQTLSLLL
jgi:hypothetical protein